jgi:signal transduction histidine kinase
LIGLLDNLTGWELSLFVFYALPVLLAVWWGSLNLGILLAVTNAAIWWVANQDSHPYQTQWGYNWAMISRLIYFTFVAVGTQAIRNKQASDAARIQMLEERRQLERDIVTVSEHEQRRIGQDLHDGLCQQLAAIGCAARALADDLHARALPEAEDAARIEEAIQETVIEARSMARGIFPVHVDRSGLSAALADLARSVSKLTGVAVTTPEDTEVNVNDPDISMNLYRIAQEAVANAVRHSGATEVKLLLQVFDDNLVLEVADNGRGILGEETINHDGMGLRTMRYRAQMLGADLQVLSQINNGTKVRCVMKAKTETTL